MQIDVSATLRRFKWWRCLSLSSSLPTCSPVMLLMLIFVFLSCRNFDVRGDIVQVTDNVDYRLRDGDTAVLNCDFPYTQKFYRRFTGYTKVIDVIPLNDGRSIVCNFTYMRLYQATSGDIYIYEGDIFVQVAGKFLCSKKTAAAARIMCAVPRDNAVLVDETTIRKAEEQNLDVYEIKANMNSIIHFDCPNGPESLKVIRFNADGSTQTHDYESYFACSQLFAEGHFFEHATESSVIRFNGKRYVKMIEPFTCIPDSNVTVIIACEWPGADEAGKPQPNKNQEGHGGNESWGASQSSFSVISLTSCFVAGMLLAYLHIAI